MRRSDAHEYRQAYNAQAVACASDTPGFAATILAMEKAIGPPAVVLADTGCASGQAVAALEARGIEPLVAIGRTGRMISGPRHHQKPHGRST